MIKVGVFFGGKSVEHEISIITANQAYESMDKEKYEIIPIYISKKGLFYTGNKLFDLKEYKNIDELLKKCTQITIINDGSTKKIIRYPMKNFSNNIINSIDIAFPIMHGTNGEDGSIQGFLEVLGIPYVGCDVVSSAIGMDKIITKRVLKEAGIPVVDYVSLYSMDYIKDEEKYMNEIESKINYPIIVKAGNLGSSVGIKKANDRQQLRGALDFAIQFSDRVIVEKAVKNLREINCSVIGDMIDVQTSVLEEPISSDEILSYNDKYVQEGGKNASDSQGMATAKREIPAKLDIETEEKIRYLASETFKVLGCSGVSRVDFLIDKDSNEVFVNEINTIPGALSYYLWEATGKTFANELTELIELSFKRNRQREKLMYSYDQNILALNSLKTGMKK